MSGHIKSLMLTRSVLIGGNAQHSLLIGRWDLGPKVEQRSEKEEICGLMYLAKAQASCCETSVRLRSLRPTRSRFRTDRNNSITSLDSVKDSLRLGILDIFVMRFM